MTAPTERDIDGILDTYKEETEDLWEQFMEGDSPDPQKYDDFLDTATSKAKQALTSLIKELVAEAKPGTWVDPEDTDDLEWQGYVNGVNDFEQNLLKALEEL